MDCPRDIGLMPRARRDHDETTTAEPQPGLQGMRKVRKRSGGSFSRRLGGVGGHSGREDVGRTGPAIRRAPEPITQWRSQLLEGASGVFGAASVDAAPAVDVKTLHAKIGELTLENDFLSVALGKAGLSPGARR